jgi:hypothetical protein
MGFVRFGVRSEIMIDFFHKLHFRGGNRSLKILGMMRPEIQGV